MLDDVCIKITLLTAKITKIIQISHSNIYMYFACLSVCPFVSKKKSKRLNRSGPNFAWDFTCPQGRFINDQNFKNLPQTKFDFF